MRTIGLLSKSILFIVLLFAARVCEANTIETIAGSFINGYYGDGQKAWYPFSAFYGPRGIYFDSSKNIYISDTSNHIIRKIDKTTQIIKTIVGEPQTSGYSGDGGLATFAKLNSPRGIHIDSFDNLYIVDSGNSCVRKVDALTNKISTIIGIPLTPGYSGGGGLATSAKLSSPTDVHVDSKGNIFISDTGNHIIRKVDNSTKNITTFAGTSESSGYFGDGGIATSAKLTAPSGIYIDSSGNVYIADFSNKVIRKVDHATQIITTIAGNSGVFGCLGNGIPTSSPIAQPSDISIDSYGNTYISDLACNVIRKIDNLTQTISIIAGDTTIGYRGDGGLATSARFSSPVTFILDEEIMYIADASNNVIRKLNLSSNIITTAYGIQTGAFYGDNQVAGGGNLPKLDEPKQTIVDTSGNILICDKSNNVIRKIDAETGIITTIAGTVYQGYTGDGGPATSARLNWPQGLALDVSGNLYIADTSNNVIRKVDIITKNITTFAGTGTAGYLGDGSNAISAQLNGASALAVSINGDVYIADTSNNRIRKVDHITKIISTVAGTGTAGNVGDGGLATSAQLNNPTGLCFDSLNNLIIVDKASCRIRKIDAKTKKITTIAGTVCQGYSGDGGLATSAQLNAPLSCAVDRSDNIFIADTNNHVIRYIHNTTKIIQTVAGVHGSYGYSDNYLDPMSSMFNFPSGLSIDPYGSLIIADTSNNVIRKVSFNCSGVLSNDKSVCSGQGTCLISGVCICNDGFFGDDCEISYCDSIISTDPKVCSGHGVCSSGVCQCNDKWDGHNCSIPLCYGASGRDGCNHHGVCTLNNTCQCDSNWLGGNCSIPSCNGTRADDSNVCNGKGQCIGIDKCHCTHDWTGQFCEQPTCFGFNLSNPMICSSHGKCISLNTCQCYSNWYGTNCSIPSCNGTRADYSSVCNGKGSCCDEDKCLCNSGWTGQFCEEAICFGLNESNPLVCSGNGQCVDFDNCQCNSKWFDANCSIHSCNETKADDYNVCNGKGICYDIDKCLCNSGWTGQFCKEAICFGLNESNPVVCSGNGQCVDFNTCQCDSNWFGGNCSIPSCNGTRADNSNVCNGKGQCIGIDNCQCNNRWSGELCSVTTCFGFNSSDALVCSGNGECSDHNTCQCHSKWYGANCSIPSCNGIVANNGSVCSSKGKCATLDVCECFDGFNGSNCEIHTCFGKDYNDPSVCSNSKGICSESNKCICFETVNGKTTGQDCSSIKCIGANNEWVDSNDANVCSKHGTCQFTNSSNIECQCSNGYNGNFCQWSICFGLSGNSNQVCGGHGNCLTPNQCSCHDNDIDGHYTGAQCEICKAPYSGPNCKTIVKCSANETCNSHGSCSEYGFCNCYQDNLKGYWNGTSCQVCNAGYFGEECLTRAAFLSNVKFNNQGNAIIFQMSYPPYFETINIDCKDLLDSEKISSFGSNPSCYYTNRTSNDFIIELDQDHLINVHDEIKLNRNVFNRISKAKDFGVFKVEIASQPTSPLIYISQKNSYSSCENVQLDASQSYSLDRKELSFKWEIVNSNLISLSSDNSSKLSINYQDLNSGSHTLKLTVTSSVLKTSDSKQVTFQKLAYSTPIISIDGNEKISVKIIELPFIVRKKIVLPECLAPNPEVIVNWEYSSGNGAQYQVDSFNNLKISKFNDLSQTSHQFTVSTFVKGSEQQKSSAIVDIELIPSALSVNLLMVESSVNVVTFEVEEIDLDGEDVQFTRSWSFNNLSNSNTILNYLESNSNNTSFTITKQMAGGLSQFDITLQSAKGSRSSKSTISLKFPASVIEIPPIITLVNSPPSTINKGNLLNIQLLVSGEGSITREWTLNSKYIPQNMTDTMRVSLSDSNSIILNTDTLDENSLNQVLFNVTNVGSGLSSTFEHSFKINKNPSSCKCQVLPSTGIAMTTLFTFNCPTCQNDAKTFNFEYGFVDDHSGSQITLSKDEELYQKLPIPYSGSQLQLYVKVIDSMTGASTISYQSVTISLPYFKSIVDIQKLAKSWNVVASLLPVGDYRRSVFNTATISRTTTKMVESLSRRSVCNGNGQIGTYGKCICNQGFVSYDCKWTTEQFETIQQLFSDLLNDLINSNQVKLQSGELANRQYLTNMLFGLDSILENYEFFNSKLFNSSLTVLNECIDSVESNSYLSFTSGEIIYLKGIFNSLYKYTVQSNENTYGLTYQSRKLGNLILRSVLIGQSPIKFETNYHLNVLNKHFKSELNSMILQSENTNITLPSLISQLITTKSIKTPVTYDWNILKDGSSMLTLPQKSGFSVSLVSIVNELRLNPSPSLNQDSKIIYSVKLNSFKNEATYGCYHMSNSEAITATGCSIKVENETARCECSQIYNIAILEYTPIINTPTNEKSTINGISDLYWILWAFLIALCILIIISILIIVIVVIIKRKKPTNSPHQPSVTLEMKQV